MTVSNIIPRSLPIAREIQTESGESAGLTCPCCGSREYPQSTNVARCSGCDRLYRIPEGYYPRKLQRKTPLEQILREDHVAAGLKLKQDAEFVYLVQNGRPVATFSAQGATFDEIWREADLALAVEVK